MGKPTICIGENKGTDQLRSNCEADQRLSFRYSDSTIPLLLNPKFQASSSFLCLYKSVCVRPVRKPHCWFSHEAAHVESSRVRTLLPTGCVVSCKTKLLLIVLHETSKVPSRRGRNI